MTSNTQCARAIERQEAGSLLSGLARLLRRIPVAFKIGAERRMLMSMSDRTLKDIGLSRSDAYREASRPWWRIPDNR